MTTDIGVDPGDVAVILREHNVNPEDGRITGPQAGDVRMVLNPMCERTVPELYRDPTLDDPDEPRRAHGLGAP